MLRHIIFLIGRCFYSKNSLKILMGLVLVFNLLTSNTLAQDSFHKISGVSDLISVEKPLILSDSMFSETGVIQLGMLDGWYFTSSDSAHFRNVEIDLSNWERVNPSELSISEYANDSGYIKGWMRLTFEVDSTMINRKLFLKSGTWGAMEVYVNGVKERSFGVISDEQNRFSNYNPLNVIIGEFNTRFKVDETYTLAFRMEDRDGPWLNINFGLPYNVESLIMLTSDTYIEYIQQVSSFANLFQYTITSALLMILLLVMILYFLNRNDFVIRDAMIFVLLFTIINTIDTIPNVLDISLIGFYVSRMAFEIMLHLIFAWIPLFLNSIFIGSRSSWMKWLMVLAILIAIISFIADSSLISYSFIVLCGILSLIALFKGRSNYQGQNKIILFAVVGQLILISGYIIMEQYYSENPATYLDDLHIMIIFLFFPVMLVIYLAVRYTNNVELLQEKLTEVQILSEENIAKEREKQKLITMQKQVLEKEVEIRTNDLKESLENLQSTQQQLIQQEKLASLGQLTAGIAHEIKNPLNFVNNFSSVSIELIDEVSEEVSKLQQTETSQEIQDILNDVKSNLSKIHEHGTRADRIIKSMLMHSRGEGGIKEVTDFNEVVKEYVNLAYLGMRSGTQQINVNVDVSVDDKIGLIPIITEDFSRVILNLCNNAFDAMREKIQSDGKSYNPELLVRTVKKEEFIYLEIEDNGPGISNEIREKIFQPFFTTKKGTEGTGLGLSITHNIIKAHGGVLTMESEPGKTLFRIQVPLSKF